MKNTDCTFDSIYGFMSGDRSLKTKYGSIDFGNLSPLTRVLLVTDGTVTRLLEAYLLEPISVERICQQVLVTGKDIPLLDIKKHDKVIKRKVLLKGRRSGCVYAFAESYIRTDRLKRGIRKDLETGKIGIGEILHDKRIETRRELITCGYRKAGKLSGYFGLCREEPLLFRTYLIFTGGKPVIMITEHFPDKR